MMLSLLGRLKFAWDYFLRGRHHLPQVVAPPDFDYPMPDAQLMAFLVGMYREHGAVAVRIGNWVCVDGGRLFTRAAHLDHRKHPARLILQTDFITLPATGQHIAESFAGIGNDVASALQDACRSFQDSSFHVLFATLLERPCNHVDRETWTIDGCQRLVTFGWLRTRGRFPLDEWPPVFEGIQRQVKALSLSQGLHWVRYFYSHLPSEAPTIETLIDNEPHDELQAQAAELPWPSAEVPYTARLFFTIQDA